MSTNDESKFRYFLFGLGIGAIAGLVGTLLSRKETREYLRERGGKSLDYLNQQGKQLRESAEGIVEKGKVFLSRRCCSVESTTEDGKQAAQEEGPGM
jgi:gas vesicle protein